MCYLFAKFLLNFCGSATFRTGGRKVKKRKPFTTHFCSPSKTYLF